MEHPKAIAGLVRARHTAQVVGIVAIVSLKGGADPSQSIPVVASILLLAVALFFLDDAHDYRSDALVHPERAVPRGAVKPKTVYLVGAILLFSGAVLASLLPTPQFLVFAAIATSGLVLVFIPLRSTARSIFTALMIWALFPFSYTSMNLRLLLFGLLVGLPHIGGSIAKDFIHSRGDERIGLSPPSRGLRYVAASSFLLCSIVAWMPLSLGLVNWTYALFIFPTFLCSSILGLKVLRGQYERVYAYGAVGMAATLMAFIFDLY